MSEFKVIETQEQLEEVLKDRLGREKKKHGDEIAALQAQIADLQGKNEQLTKDIENNAEKYANYDSEIEGLRSKVTGYETAAAKREIAKEFGLPDEMISRLKGDNADEWKQDAESLKGLFQVQNLPPLADNTPGGGDDKAEYRKMLRDMKGDN